MKLIKFGLLLLLLFIVATAAIACNSGADEPLPILTATVQRGDLKTEVTASGNLSLAETADLAFDVDGTVEKVLVEQGDPVTEGQILAELDRFGLDVNYQPRNQSGGRTSQVRTVVPWENQKRDLENAVLKAKASLNDAQIALKDAKSPQNSDAAPDPINVQNKQYQVEIAEAALTSAQAELEQFLQTSPEIKAPFDGFVTAVNVEGGDVVAKGAVAVTVAANDKFETKIFVSELDIRQVQIGMPATVQVLAAGGALYPATVTAISPTATNQGGVVSYEVAVGLQSTQPIASSSSAQPPTTQSAVATSADQATSDQQSATNTAVKLRDGFTVTVKILIQEKKDVIMVPNRAIIRDKSATSVQVMVNGTPETRPVTLGFTNGLNTEVTKGLSEGEEVVIQEPKTTTSSTQSQSNSNVRIFIR